MIVRKAGLADIAAVGQKIKKDGKISENIQGVDAGDGSEASAVQLEKVDQRIFQ